MKRKQTKKKNKTTEIKYKKHGVYSRLIIIINMHLTCATTRATIFAAAATDIATHKPTSPTPTTRIQSHLYKNPHTTPKTTTTTTATTNPLQ